MPKSRTLIPDVNEHIRSVLTAYAPSKGSVEFAGEDYVPWHDSKYPADRTIYTRKGKQTFEHHIVGMLSGYVDAFGRSRIPRVDRLGRARYRFG